VTATAKSGAGIGNGSSNSSVVCESKIEISGGYVVATSTSGAGIGAGEGSTDKSVFTTGDDGNATIVASSIGDNDSIKGWSGLILDGAKGKIYPKGGSYALQQDLRIPAGTTLTVNRGTLTIQKGVTLTISRGASLTEKETESVIVKGRLVDENEGTEYVGSSGGSGGSGSGSSGGGSSGGGNSSGGGALVLVVGAVAVAVGGVLWWMFFNKEDTRSGIARDEAGNVLPNATILVQQTQQGQLVTVQTTTADANGSYTIKVPNGAYTILAQYTDPATGQTRTVEQNSSENGADTA
jgi:hypothetical protein